MEFQIKVELDDETKNALRRVRELKVAEQVKKIADDLYWLNRIVHEVILAPDERQQAIRAGYGE